MALQIYKLRLSWTALLIFVLFLSKEVYIINEETLVLVAFTSFILLMYGTISKLLVNELDERAHQIKKEFEILFENREKALKALINSYKRQYTLSEELRNLTLAIQWIIKFVIQQSEIRLNQALLLAQKQKLVSLFNKENGLLGTIQYETSEAFSKTIKQISANTYYKRALAQDSINNLLTPQRYDQKNALTIKQYLIKFKMLNVPANSVILLNFKKEL